MNYPFENLVIFGKYYPERWDMFFKQGLYISENLSASDRRADTFYHITPRLIASDRKLYTHRCRIRMHK